MRNDYSNDSKSVDGLRVTLIQLINSRHIIHLVHWNVIGMDFGVIHNKLDKYIKKVSEDIDMIAEMMKTIDRSSNIPDLLEIAENRSLVNVPDRVTPDVGWHITHNEFINIITCMRNVYDSLPSSMQSDIDTSVAYYDKEANYKIAATLE